MIAILAAVLFTLLLVVGNTMAQAVRERTSELAVLKTLGFSSGLVMTLVLIEAVFISIVGGALGLGVAWLIVQTGDPTGGMLPTFELPSRDVINGLWLMLAVGLLSGALPAVSAMRIRIVDALRKV
jgi:putative ABC transport system permease protein